MRYKILFLNQAKEDVHQARMYYNDTLPKLGTRFRADLRAVIYSIAENPYSNGFRFENFRTSNLTIFPYQVHYIIEEDLRNVIVFAVLHAQRDPGFISRRLGQ